MGLYPRISYATVWYVNNAWKYLFSVMIQESCKFKIPSLYNFFFLIFRGKYFIFLSIFSLQFLATSVMSTVCSKSSPFPVGEADSLAFYVPLSCM